MQPSLVWSEILSLIKGSFEAMSKLDGHLTLEEYIDIGRKKSPFFSGERDVIYAIYMKYKRFIRKEAMFDEADVVFDIYKRCKAELDMPWTIHQLYVDETQDFTQAELLLLMSISQNPNDIFLTGDTAQCIMRGIAFRFCDIQACFHHVRECSSAEAKSQMNVPKIQKLVFNYRSHSGILSLASSVLDIMTEYFKESFDSLEKDVGLFHGKRPLLLECCSSQDLEMFLKESRESKDTGQGSIIFGSHQAILVANQEAKATLPTVFKENANVLTICECKGLEFDDVLLYNFFKDSQVTKEWRVVTSFQNSLGLYSTGNDLRALEFDTLKHKLLNSELKYLYTALTRARCNLWIYDEDTDKRAPMFEYFKARKLVRGSEKSSDTFEEDGLEFAKASNAEDWVQQGDTFMTHRLYMDAAKCYRRAGDDDKRLSAIAYNKAVIAMTKSDEAKRKSYFLSAAADFLKCNKITKSGTCLRYADEYVLSGLAYEKNGEYAAAARMYRQGGDYEAERRCRDLKRCFQNP
ncbi:TPR and ankyrin repeat-containing protein 1-like [Haliotis rufescens]|uniref:TPR and ankyrin repeat-containing protein 1-like n=1 Tax=Haliotis rufescens TaxID=6454 RepID=UPI00201EA8B6|nr:TPR and ankyrin repeat-containing protein 1-like [Haliotis rufescens]